MHEAMNDMCAQGNDWIILGESEIDVLVDAAPDVQSPCSSVRNGAQLDAENGRSSALHEDQHATSRQWFEEQIDQLRGQVQIRVEAFEDICRHLSCEMRKCSEEIRLLYQKISEATDAQERPLAALTDRILKLEQHIPTLLHQGGPMTRALDVAALKEDLAVLKQQQRSPSIAVQAVEARPRIVPQVPRKGSSSLDAQAPHFSPRPSGFMVLTSDPHSR